MRRWHLKQLTIAYNYRNVKLDVRISIVSKLGFSVFSNITYIDLSNLSRQINSWSKFWCTSCIRCISEKIVVRWTLPRRIIAQRTPWIKPDFGEQHNLSEHRPLRCSDVGLPGRTRLVVHVAWNGSKTLAALLTVIFRISFPSSQAVPFSLSWSNQKGSHAPNKRTVRIPALVSQTTTPTRVLCSDRRIQFPVSILTFVCTRAIFWRWTTY